ncbi:MAG: sugar ABC transporter substrate-binding protein [Nanoarchaeota archaeon]|nr:sugar ABC transporter substrate-binding protein [Nanoarchaeota archaeon]
MKGQVNARVMFVRVLSLCLIISVLSGCRSADTVPESRLIDTENKITIGFSLGTLKEERWVKDRDFFVERANQLGAQVNVMSANADPGVQMSQAENLILQKVDILVIVPEDAERTAEIVKKAHAAGIKVLSYDRLIKNSEVDLYISFQNEKVGELQANRLLETVSKGNFVYVGGAPTDNNAFLFRKGAMGAISEKVKTGDIVLVYDNFTTEWRPDIAYQNMKDLLKDNPDIDAIIAANDGTASGVIKALDEAGLSGKIPVSGQDAELGACQRIIKGTQTMTVYKPIKPLAYKAAELAVMLAKGENPEVNSAVNNGKIDVPSYLLEPVMVDKDNMMDTIVKDGYHPYEEVYLNVPLDERPIKN